MIPADLTARLRMLTEASFFEADQPVQALNRTRPTPADLPEFTPGQRLAVTIESPLPDGLFRALVAGKTVTLALPQGTDADLLQPGRTLAMEVTRSTPQAIHAQLVPPQAEPDLPPSLSQTGRLISVLLTGQPPAEPAPLAAGQPLLAAPPATGAALAPVLQEALSRSGMFYESHQAQWLAGKISTATLLQEPQGQIPAPAAQTGGLPTGESEPARPDVATAHATTPAPTVPGSPLAAQEPENLEHRAQQVLGVEPEPPGPARPAQPTSGTGLIPERILPLVGQQLDALATQQFVWQGQVWPGQTMEWQIEDSTGGSGGGVAAADQTWNTTLRLTLPRLGSVEARLQLIAGGVSVHLLAAEPEAQAALAAGREALARGLDAAHLALRSLSVEPADGQQ